MYDLTLITQTAEKRDTNTDPLTTVKGDPEKDRPIKTWVKTGISLHVKPKVNRVFLLSGTLQATLYGHIQPSNQRGVRLPASTLHLLSDCAEYEKSRARVCATCSSQMIFIEQESHSSLPQSSFV